MTENEAIIKIIANHTREYNELDRLYKKLGVKHLTLMEVHKKSMEKMAQLESQHHDLREGHAITVERAATVKLLYTQSKGENKKLKVLLQVATKEIQKQRKEIVEDLKEIDINDGEEPYDFVVLKKKWEGKSC